MSIAVRVHGRPDPAALAELIAATLHDQVVIDGEATIAHLALLVAAEEQEAARRRDSWHWLNTITPPARPDRDNDWSDV